jgi:hypothetical protein
VFFFILSIFYCIKINNYKKKKRGQQDRRTDDCN